MSLIATSRRDSATKIEMDGFWPSICLDEARKEMRVFTAIDDPHLTTLLKQAYIVVIDSLDEYAHEMEQKGYKTLKEVPAPKVGNQTRQEILFYQALYCYTRKLIGESYPDVDLTRKAGSDKSAAIKIGKSDWHAQYLMAIRAFLGKPRGYVALI